MKKVVIIVIASLIYACGAKKDNNENPTPLAKPPVTVTNISIGEIYQQQEFNAYSNYLKKEIIRAPISGYIRGVFVTSGDQIKKGQTLFTLQTPEANALANVHIKHDSLLNLSSLISVRASKEGTIINVNYQQDAFVQQGEQLADAIARDAIVFIVNVPFEYTREISRGMKLKIELPGSRTINATIGEPLPTNNTTNQVQSFILRPDSSFFIPSNINATARIKTDVKENVQRLPKEAILTNETQTSFWVMKLTNDTTAVRVDIKRGLTSNGMVEILQPSFSKTDRILFKGQYGLPDTAYVNVLQR